MKNTQSRIKWIKTGTELGTTYCLGCKVSQTLSQKK